MEYKYHSDEFKGMDADAADREGAPNRHIGVVHAGSGWNYTVEPMGKLGLGKSSLYMPSLGKPKTMENSLSRYMVEELYDARSKKIVIPPLQEMPISDLKSPYIKPQVILIDTPGFADADGCNKYVRESFGIFYDILQDMAPAVTFKPNNKALKCKGSFTQDFCTCRFEAQVWRVDASLVEEENVYIFEFRQKTLSGRDAFEYLIRHMGAALKDAGRAKVYGDGMEILPPGWNPIPDDLGELAMPSFAGMGSHTSVSCRNNKAGFPIALDRDLMNSWCDIIVERQWPSYEETLRTLARCCCDDDNKKVMAEHSDLQKALINDLQLETDSTNCHNILTILNAILEEASSDECVIEDGILLAVAETFMTHTGLKQQRGASKVSRSVSLGRVALKILLILSEKPKQYNQKQVRDVLKVLEGAQKKLKDEVNQEHLEYVIGNLRKQSQ